MISISWSHDSPASPSQRFIFLNFYPCGCALDFSINYAALNCRILQLEKLLENTQFPAFILQERKMKVHQWRVITESSFASQWQNWGLASDLTLIQRLGVPFSTPPPTSAKAICRVLRRDWYLYMLSFPRHICIQKQNKDNNRQQNPAVTVLCSSDCSDLRSQGDALGWGIGSGMVIVLGPVVRDMENLLISPFPYKIHKSFKGKEKGK